MGLLQGISAPQLTPFHEDGSVNFEEYERLSDYLAEAGLQGIFVCGTTGEFVNLTIEERELLLLAAVKGSKGRSRIMFNVTAMNLRDIRLLSEFARDHGADCLSLTPPYYHHYDDAAMEEYFVKAANAAADMPVYLYNMPGMTHNPLTPNVLNKVCARCENVVGIKDSSMDHMTFLDFQLAKPREDFELITGNDAQVLTALMAGGVGGVIALAGVYPKLCQKIYDDFMAGDMTGAKEAQDKIHKLRAMVRRVMPIMAHKEMLKMQGFNMGPARFPFRELTQGEKKEIHDCVESLGLM